MYFDMLPESGGYEFHRDPSDSKGFVLCIHGFSGSPVEIKPLAEVLYNDGYSVSCPILPGHGIKDRNEAKKAFSEITSKKLIEFVKSILKVKREIYSKIFLIGQSMGGIITFNLANDDECKLNGAVTTAAPLFLPLGSGFAQKLLSPFNITLKVKKPPHEQGWSYDFINARASGAVLEMIGKAKTRLDKINIPILLCYSKKDKTSVKTGKFFEKSHPNSATFKWFNTSEHVMLLDQNANTLIEEIKNYINIH